MRLDRNHTLFVYMGGTDGSGASVKDVVFDKHGNLYGTTELGGNLNCNPPYGCGTVFQLTPSGSGWTEESCMAFREEMTGASPESGVTFDEAGNPYGTTYQGGGSGCGGKGCGTVYQLTAAGSGWKENILHTFQGGTDGGNPFGGLIFDELGNSPWHHRYRGLRWRRDGIRVIALRRKLDVCPSVRLEWLI